MLDALGDRLMYRLAYRNLGDHEALVANHTVVSGGGNVGVRWYEIRSPNGPPTIYQQGTYAPDGDNRWMASVAQDKSGNIAVGYSTASSVTYPSIRYTGWETGNPLGTLQAENTLIAGGGVQNSYNRWGDYSAMRIDPTDDCTFWYTQEYYQTTQDGLWYTRIGSFKFSSCGGATKTATTTSLGSSLNPSKIGQSVTFTAAVTSGGGTPTGSITFKDGSTTIGSGTLSGGGASMSTSTLAGGSHSITAVYAGDSTFNGSTSSALTQAVDKANSTTTVSSSLNPSKRGQTVTFTATVSPSSATGSVGFYDGTKLLSTKTLSGATASYSTSTLAAGLHTISAKYAGDSNFNGSTSNVLTQTVTRK
jgi:hypothetical protein